MAKAKKKITDSLTNSSDIKLKQVNKKPGAKSAKVDQLNPKAKNKDTLTSNIQSRSAKKIGDKGLGKIQRVPVSQKRSDSPKKKK